MSLLSDLKQRPSNLSKPSKFTLVNGIFYVISGLSAIIWPGQIQMLYFDRPFVGDEQGLFRAIGVTITVIGWLYFFGGRTGSRQFVAATVLERLTLVPIVLGLIAIAGVFPHVLLTFAILDPILALIAWYLLAKSKDQAL